MIWLKLRVRCGDPLPKEATRGLRGSRKSTIERLTPDDDDERMIFKKLTNIINNKFNKFIHTHQAEITERRTLLF